MGFQVRGNGGKMACVKTPATQPELLLTHGKVTQGELSAVTPDPESSMYLQPCLPLPLEAFGRGWQSLTRQSPKRPGRIAASVFAFHRAFGLPRRTRPSLDGVSGDLLALRERLLDEEATEFAVASHERDLVGMADALADVVYVAYGTAVTLGLDLDLILDEVHRSNMSKLDEDGRPILRHDGKVIKSPRYRPPDVSGVIATQPTLPF
jgi:predicted HAD superfamily Cof-like phosphohydrolase